MSQNNIKYDKFISITLERECISALLKYPNLWPEVQDFINEDCFNDEDKVHRVIFAVIKKHYNNKGLEKLSTVLIAEDLKSLNIGFKGDLDIYSYIESCITQITEKAAKDSFKELVKRKVCLDLAQNARKEYLFIQNNLDKDINDIISGVDTIHNSKVSSLNSSIQTKKTENIFETMEEKIEYIGNNPPDNSKFMMGPFDTINRLYGSLHKQGQIVVTAARSGVGKTSISMFVNSFVAEKYGIPVLAIDNGEMSEEELQFRAACMFTEGKVPYHALEDGTWRNNKEWEHLVRAAMKRAKKIKYYYVNGAGLSPDETICLLRREAYSTIGRNNFFLTNYDYLKSFDNDYNNPDYAVMGKFIKDTKNVIKNEINTSFWTSLQMAKSGITNNKTAAQVDDSEGSFTISDKIVQQSTHSFIIRNKTIDEIAFESNKFGNLKAICVKHRHLGKDFYDALTPVKVGKNKYQKNYVNLQGYSFHFEDRGDLNKMMNTINNKIDTQDTGKIVEVGGDADL